MFDISTLKEKNLKVRFAKENSADTFLDLIEHYEEQGDIDNALSLLNKVNEYKLDGFANARLFMIYSNLYLISDNAKYIETANDFLKKGADADITTLIYAYAIAEECGNNRAMTQIQKACENKDDEAFADLYDVLFMLADEGDNDSIFYIIDLALNILPDNPLLLIFKADMLVEFENLDQAEQLYLQALKLADVKNESLLNTVYQGLMSVYIASEQFIKLDEIYAKLGLLAGKEEK